jgi:hypothetical protein
MKNLIIVLLTFLLATHFLFAQGPAGSNPGGPIVNDPYVVPYGATRPPPLGLTEAYAMSLSFVGEATNRFLLRFRKLPRKNKIRIAGLEILILQHQSTTRCGRGSFQCPL